MKLDISAWPQDHQDAIRAYVAAKGIGWMHQLAADWYSGRDTSFPKYGHILRQIRNHPEQGRAVYAAMRYEEQKCTTQP